MNRIVDVYLYELRRNIRRKGFLFATFGIPILGFVLAFGYSVIQSAQTNDTPANPVAILNEFDFESVKKAGIVDPSGVFPGISAPLQDVLIPYADEPTARTALQAGAVDVYYTISEDYLATGNVTLYLPSFSISKMTSQPIEQLFYTTLAKDVDPQILARLRSPITVSLVNLAVSQDATTDEDANFVMMYVFAFTLLLGLFLTNGYLLQSIIEEKENRVIEILMTSLRPSQLLAGKILAFSTLGMLQIGVWALGIVLMLGYVASQPAFATATALLNIRLPYDQMPILFLYFLFGYLLFSGFFAAVGAISNSMREGPSYAALFTIPAALPFYFFTVFTTTPNAPLPVFLSIFPLTAPISMMMRLSATDVPPLEIGVSLALLLASALGIMWLAGRIFRIQSLLSGKVPKLKDIPALIRA